MRTLLVSLLLGLLLGLCLPAPTAALPPRDRIWSIGPILDQGETPSCVGYAWLAYLHAGPHPLWPDFNGYALYSQAKLRDGHPTEPGTWEWAAEAALRDAGYIATVQYTTNLTDTLRYLQTTGPVVVDAVWPGGFGTRHAFLLYGVNARMTRVWLQNSWGVQWGNRGTWTWPVDTLRTIDAWYAWPTKAFPSPWRILNGWET